MILSKFLRAAKHHITFRLLSCLGMPRASWRHLVYFSMEVRLYAVDSISRSLTTLLLRLQQ